MTCKVNRYTNSIDASLFFYIGLFLIPFDNLVFAPSSGWATIAPFSFLLYFLFNIKNFRFSYKNIIVLLIFLFPGPIHGFFYNSFGNVFETIVTVLLGVSFYLSLCVFSFQHKKTYKKKICRILFIAYLISFIYGILSVLPIEGINRLFSLIEKRHYNRLSFTFTEPSFISMHLFGVIFPFAFYCKDKRLLFLGCLFLIVTLIFGSSIRFIVDCFVIAGLYLAFYCYKKGSFYFICFLCVSISLAFLIVPLLSMIYPRINEILNGGIYFDASLASRWFRMNAIIHGYDFSGFVFGYGSSNTWIPFQNGYIFAFNEYSNPFVDEIVGLKNSTDSSFFCLPLRVISEIGFIGFLFLIISLFDSKHSLYFLIIFWLYLQFDSYAFYALWIYIFVAKFNHVTSKCICFNKKNITGK